MNPEECVAAIPSIYQLTESFFVLKNTLDISGIFVQCYYSNVKLCTIYPYLTTAQLWTQETMLSQHHQLFS